MNTQVEHTSYTDKAGYVWRKRYIKNTLSIALQTKEHGEAFSRSSAMTLRFMELEILEIPFDAMRDTLKAYRDKLIRSEKLIRLQALVSGTASPEALQGVSLTAPMQEAPLAVRIEQETLQRELASSAGHTLEEAKESYFNASTEWAVKTKKDYSACIDRFIVWCAANNINTIEAVKKEHIISFKSYMDENNLASNTKQKILTRLGSMFKFCVEINEWIEKKSDNRSYV